MCALGCAPEHLLLSTSMSKCPTGATGLDYFSTLVVVMNKHE